MLILGEDNNTLENFELYEDEKSILEKQDIKRDLKNLVNKSSDTGSCTRDGLSERTPKARLFANNLSLASRKFRFSKREFSAGKPVLDIKYYHLSFQNNNFFHPFNNQLDYVLPTILQSLKL